MLQNVTVSVGRTWRLTRGTGEATVSEDKTGYEAHLNRLKGGVQDPFQLPWPPYASTLWRHWFAGPSYKGTRTSTLAAALLPLQHEHVVHRARFEALLHPFAVSTIAHLDLGAVEPWPPDAEAATLLDDFLRQPLEGTNGQVRDGVPLDALHHLPTADAGLVPATFEPAGEFVLLSALHQEAPDPASLAYRLASLFGSSASDKSRPMNTDASAIAVTGGRAGFVLARAQPRSGARVRCLHRNLATLLGELQNLATLTPASTTVPAAWFQTRAALVLNHLYRRAPLPETSGVYKSQLAELWLRHRGLAAAINQVTAGAASPPTALPTA